MPELDQTWYQRLHHNDGTRQTIVGGSGCTLTLNYDDSDDADDDESEEEGSVCGSEGGVWSDNSELPCGSVC